MYDELIQRVAEAFAAEGLSVPPMSLRSGNQLDDYKPPIPYDESVDAISDQYLHQYSSGVAFLDPISWKYYLPPLVGFSLRHISRGELATLSLLSSLRPPDRVPSRLGSLNPVQEAVITAFLDILAFAEGSVWQDMACQILDEWWLPNALYRKDCVR